MMVITKKVLALALVLVLVMAVSASAQQALPAPAAQDLQKLAGKWSGWATGTSGSAVPVEVVIQPDGTYVSRIGTSSGQGVIKVDGGKFMTQGHLSGPAGVAAGPSQSQLTVATKGQRQVMSGRGRTEAGPFDYELTKE
jgi:hypothetical protein